MFRTKSRKEKNKLASRACRLKKKAQHEANKIKLSGLEDEHSKCNIADACKAINWECWSLQIYKNSCRWADEGSAADQADCPRKVEQEQRWSGDSKLVTGRAYSRGRDDSQEITEYETSDSACQNIY